MNRKRSLSYWAKWITGIWLGFFSLILVSLIVGLYLQDWGGLTTAKVRDTIIQIIQIYLPYFGIIFGAFYANFQKNQWDYLVDSMFPLLVLFISVLLNFLIFTFTLIFLFDKYANVEDYVSDIKAIALVMSFFIAWFLSKLLYTGSQFQVQKTS